LGADTFTYYYSGRLNKCLSEKNDSRNFECEDYGIPTDSVVSFTIYDTDEVILGQKCRILDFQSQLSQTLYYISRDKHLAPETYQQHLAYNWSFYGKEADGGLILKLEHRFPNYKMKGIAIQVVERPPDFQALEIYESTILTLCDDSKHKTQPGR
jgi:hypothetical protein